MTSWRVITCALATLLLAGCGGGGSDSGTHSFVGKADDLVLYLTWNRDGDELSGSLTQGLLEEGERVETSRVSFTGTISGSGVTLDLKQPYGSSSTLTGKLDDDALSLEYLRPQEGLVTVQLREGGAGVFNAELATLRDRIEQTKVDAVGEAAETSEKERVAQHAQTVEDDLAALKTALAAALSAKGPNAASNLARLRRDLQLVRDHTQAALSADELSVCSSAATVQADLNTLEARAAALRSRQATREQGAGSVAEAIEKLREDFLTLQSDDPRYLPFEAPTQRTVGRAIQQALRKLRKADSPGGDPLKAVDAILKEARSLNGRASVRCRTAGA